MTSKGIVVLAQNNEIDDYVKQAYLLALSLKISNPEIKISIITNNKVPERYQDFFDNIIPVPWGDDAEVDSWKIKNRWKIYHVSPYDETIVMDTDMLVLRDISHWWIFLSKYELFFTTKVYTYRNFLIQDDFYRKAFTENNLPNLYSGFHYFKKCTFSQEFYEMLEIVNKNWELFYKEHAPKSTPEHLSIDVSAAIVCKILDVEHKITDKKSTYPSFVHLKSYIQSWQKPRDSWQKCVGVYFDSQNKVKIGNYLQNTILHYTENNFVTDEIIKIFEETING